MILLMLARFFSAIVSSLQAFAAEPPIVRCKGIPGCDAGPSNVFAETAIPAITDLLLKTAAAGAILAIMWGGFLMVMSNGDDAKGQNGRKSITFGLGGLALALSANSLVSFFVTEDFGQGSAGGGGADFLFSSLFPAAVRIILAIFNVAVAMVVIFAGIRMAMSKGKSDQFSKGGSTIMWACLGAIVVNAARAIVEAFVTHTITW